MKMKKYLAALMTVMLVSGVSCSIYGDELFESTSIVEDTTDTDVADESSGFSEEGYFGEDIFVEEEVLNEEEAFDAEALGEEEALNEEALDEDEAFDEEVFFGEDELLNEDGIMEDTSSDKYGDGSVLAGEAEMDFAGGDKLAVDETNFPDAVFRDYVKQNCDTDQDGFLSGEEIAAVEEIRIRNTDLCDLSGIRNFTSLSFLDCSFNKLTNLDVSGFSALESLWCISNELTSLNVSGCTALSDFSCNHNQLTSLDVSDCTALIMLNFGYNRLTDIDISSCTSLKQLDFTNNLLTSINVSNCTGLESLGCSANDLTSLDLSGLTSLEYVFCYSNQMTNLNVSGCTALVLLDCSINQLITLDFSDCTELLYLDCEDNQLVKLDIGSCTKVCRLECYKNLLNILDIRACDALQTAYLSGKTENEGIVTYRSEEDDLIVADSSTTIVSDGYAQELIDRINALTPDADGFYNYEDCKSILSAYFESPMDIRAMLDKSGATYTLFNIWSATNIAAQLMSIQPDPATGEYDAEEVKFARGTYEEYQKYVLGFETEQADLMPKKALQNLVTAELALAISALEKAVPADTEEFRTLLTASEKAIENAKALDLVVTDAEEVYRKKLEEYREVAKPKADTPSAPIFSEVQAVDDESITVKVTEGMEYSLNNGKTWKKGASVVVFKGLKPNTTYRLVRRIAETAEYKASDPSNGYKVKTTNNIGRLLNITASLPKGSELKEDNRSDVNKGYLVYKKKLTSNQKKQADVKAAKAELDAAKKTLDYPVISFKNTKVQEKLKGKTTETISLKEGSTLKLKATSSTGAELTYSTGKKSVASVSRDGVVTAGKKGDVNITVQSKKSKVTVKIRVTAK